MDVWLEIESTTPAQTGYKNKEFSNACFTNEGDRSFNSVVERVNMVDVTRSITPSKSIPDEQYNT